MIDGMKHETDQSRRTLKRQAPCDACFFDRSRRNGGVGCMRCLWIVASPGPIDIDVPVAKEMRLVNPFQRAAEGETAS